MPHPKVARGPTRPLSTISNGFGPGTSESLQDLNRRLRDTADEPLSPSTFSVPYWSENNNQHSPAQSYAQDQFERQNGLRKILDDFETTLLNYMSSITMNHHEPSSPKPCITLTLPTSPKPNGKDYVASSWADDDRGQATHNSQNLIDVSEYDMIKMRSHRGGVAAASENSGAWIQSRSPFSSGRLQRSAGPTQTGIESASTSQKDASENQLPPNDTMRKCFKNWKRYVYKSKEIGGRSSHSIDTLTSLDGGAYPLLPLWKKMLTEKNDTVVTSLRSKRRFSTTSISSAFLDEVTKGSTHSGWSNFSKLAANPLSYKRIIWEILGVAFITYDVVAIPLQAFEDGFSRSGQRIPMLLTAAYWTVDIPYSFFTGFFDEGRLEMRSRKRFAKYVKTWFFPDVLLVVMDWVLISFEFQQDDRLQGAQFIKYGRALRILRLLRLLRIFKLTSFFNKLIDQINSEHVLTMLRIMRLTVLIVLMNHFIACAFYALGSTEMIDPDRKMWTKGTFAEGDSTVYRYFTSLHWSLTQFMPASMEVVPIHLYERLFNVLVVISAMVVFSSFVSSITEAMTHLRDLDKKQNETVSAVRVYFSENTISMELSARVWRYLNHIARHKRRRKRWEEVAPLRDLPENLQIELKCEIFRPVMTCHPFFYHYQDVSPAAMRAICQKAAFEVSLTVGQDLFAAGDAAHSMYFVSSGMLEYAIKHEEDSPMVRDLIRKDQWAAEAAVWLHWFHLGTMTTKQDCLMIQLNARTLHDCLEKYDDTLFVAARYAWFFYEMTNMPGSFTTDLCVNFDNLQHMTQRAFSEDQSLEGPDGTASLNSRISGVSKFSDKAANWGVAYSWADVLYKSRTGDLQRRLALTQMLKRWKLM